jgi:hypothetical protein
MSSFSGGQKEESDGEGEEKNLKSDIDGHGS